MHSGGDGGWAAVATSIHPIPAMLLTTCPHAAAEAAAARASPAAKTVSLSRTGPILSAALPLLPPVNAADKGCCMYGACCCGAWESAPASSPPCAPPPGATASSRHDTECSRPGGSSGSCSRTLGSTPSTVLCVQWGLACCARRAQCWRTSTSEGEPPASASTRCCRPASTTCGAGGSTGAAAAAAACRAAGQGSIRGGVGAADG